MILVSVIMPTNNRRIFARRAIEYFKRYADGDTEMVIVDSGSRPLPTDDVQDSRIKIIQTASPISTGAMLNLGIQRSKGDIIVRQDDDDWYAPGYLTNYLEFFRSTNANVSRIDKCFYYDIFAKNAWLSPAYGGTMIFRRDLWERCPFPQITIAEDFHFVRLLKEITGGSETTFNSIDLHVHINHGRNITGSKLYKLDPVATAEAQKILGSDLEWYEALAEMRAA
jgi:glycosyltransferase involved in cell wall biosynthesis